VKKPTPTVGDRVALTRASLATLSARNAALRGTITAIESAWLATVQWDNAPASTVNVANLCKPRSVAFIE
jgi:hypothetical protein